MLQAHLDGELVEGQAGFVAAHLAQCERCGIEVELYERVKASLRELRAAPDPEALTRLRQFADALPRGVVADPEEP